MAVDVRAESPRGQRGRAEASPPGRDFPPRLALYANVATDCPGRGDRVPAAPKLPPVTMKDVSAAIVITLALLGVGIVVDQLFRLRKWLKNPPSGRNSREPPDGDM